MDREKKNKDKLTKEKEFTLLKYREVKQRNAQTQLKLIQAEKTNEQLKERLQKVTNDKTQLKAPLVINQSFKKSIDGNDIINQKVIKNLQEEKTNLQLENFELRQSIKDMNNQFDKIREQFSLGKEDKYQRFLNGEIDLPFLQVKDDIKGKFSRRIEDLEIDIKSQVSFIKSEDTKHLEHKIKEQEKIIQEQAKVILHLNNEMNPKRENISTPLKRLDDNHIRVEKSPYYATPKSVKTKENKI